MRARRASGILAIAGLAWIGSGVAGAADSPQVTLGRTSAPPGEVVPVTGTGWQPGTIIVLEVCGNEALDGAADCSAATASNVGIQPDGTFSALVDVAVPPSPCPCVLQVTSTSEVTELRVPLDVVGAPSAPPLARAAPVEIQRGLKLNRAALEGTSLKGLLGLPAQRTLVLEIENVGEVPLRGIPLMVTVGKGQDPDGYVDAPDIGDLEPGEQRVVRIPVTFDPLSFGSLTAAGSMNGIGEPVRFVAQTSNPPVVPLVVAALALQWLLLRGRNAIRRRLQRGGVGSSGEAEEDDAPAGGEAILNVDATAAADEEVIDADALIDETRGEAEPRTEVIDLDAIEHAEAPPALHNGVAHTLAVENVPADPVPAAATLDLDGARAELRTVQLQARLALKHAIELSENLVAASAARVHELEVEAAGRLRAAAARHAEAIELLETARARADEVRAAASEAAASALRDATADRAAAHQALAELEEQGQRLVDAARAAIDDAITDLDDRLRALPASLEGQADDERTDAPAPGTPAPRLGGLDLRVAAAVSRALASTSMPADPTG